MMMHRMMNYLKYLSSVLIQKINTANDTYRKLSVFDLKNFSISFWKSCTGWVYDDLPGGVVLTGGITKMDGILQLARHVLKTRVRIHTPEYIGVREPMYTTAVGLIRYAHMQDSYFGHVPDSPTVSASENHTPAPVNKKKPVERNKEKKPGILDKAKKVFDNFFE